MNVSIHQIPRGRFAVLLVVAALVLAFPTVTQAVPIQAISVTVTTLYDGQHVGVRFEDGEREMLRLKGIEVPACFQAQAAQRTSELIQARVTFLELSSTPRDERTNELVGYLWSDSVLINLALVSEGYAFPNGEGSRYDQNLKAAGEVSEKRAVGVYAKAC
jgi:endonuclease YncB( thermonuclease family)